MGAGVAEAAGLMDSLIRKLVAVSPKRLLAFILILVGVLSSVASDAGYLILIPLGAAAFMSVGRHPLAGLAACFAGVAAIFGVNLLLGPTDAMITEITNEALALAGGQPITIVSNLWFAMVSSIVLADHGRDRHREDRRAAPGPLDGYHADAGEAGDDEAGDRPGARTPRASSGAVVAVLGALVVVLLLTLPPGAPLRDPVTGDIVGQTPFMDSLLFIITLFFLVAGIGYGYGAGRSRGSNDVIAAVTKTFAGLAGLIFMLLMISQFIAIFNFSQLPNVHRGGAGAVARDGRHRGAAAAGRADPGHRGAGPDHARAGAQVGHLRAHLRAPVHPAGRARADGPCGLPRGRLAVQHADAADGLPAVHRGHRAALQEGRGHRHDHRPDAALRPHPAGRLDRAVRGLVPPGLPLGPGYPVAL